MASTYVQTDGTEDGQKFYEDVEISPVTLHDGTLYARFDTKVYPQKGIISDPAVGRATAVTAATSSAAPVRATPVTLSATVTSAGDRVATGTVQFVDGVTNVGAAQALVAGAASLLVAGGFTVGAHSITAVYSGDSRFPGATSAAVVVTAS